MNIGELWLIFLMGVIILKWEIFSAIAYVCPFFLKKKSLYLYTL